MYDTNGTTWALLPGESVATDLTIRNAFFRSVYDAVERSSSSGGPAAGSNFWVRGPRCCCPTTATTNECSRLRNRPGISHRPRRAQVLYRNDGQGRDDPYRVTLDDASTFSIIAQHRHRMEGIIANRSRVAQACPSGWTDDMSSQPWPPARLLGDIAATRSAQQRPAGSGGAGPASAHDPGAPRGNMAFVSDVVAAVPAAVRPPPQQPQMHSAHEPALRRPTPAT